MYYVYTTRYGSQVISTEKPEGRPYIETEDISQYTQPLVEVDTSTLPEPSKTDIWDELAAAIKTGVNEV